MFKLVLNDKDNTQYYIRDLLTNTIEIQIQDRSQIFDVLDTLVDINFVGSKIYDMNDVYIGNVTKKILNNSVSVHEVDGVMFGIYNVEQVTQQENEVIILNKKLEITEQILENTNEILLTTKATLQETYGIVEELEEKNSNLEEIINVTYDMLLDDILGEESEYADEELDEILGKE